MKAMEKKESRKEILEKNMGKRKARAKLAAEKKERKARAEQEAEIKQSLERKKENIHGGNGFQFGDKINTADTLNTFIAAISAAKSQTKIKRDHNTNTSIYNYLNSVDAGLGYAALHVDKYGNIGRAQAENGETAELYQNTNKEDIEDAIQDCALALQEHNGEEYTAEVFKSVRNSCGKAWTINETNKTNSERFFSKSLETEKEEHGDALESSVVLASVFAGGGGRISPVILKALDKACSTKEEKIFFIDLTTSGMSMRDYAEANNLSKSAVDRKFQKIKKEMLKLLVYNEHKYRAEEK